MPTRSIGIASVILVLLTGGACSGSESNEIDNSSDLLTLEGNSQLSITSCEKDDLGRPVAEVSITSPASANSIYFVRVRFESTDGDTDYGDATADGGLPTAETTYSERLTGLTSAPTPVRCILRNGRVGNSSGTSEPSSDTSEPSSDSTASDIGEVEVQGTPLPAFTTTEGDPAVGEPAPAVTGEAPDGQPTILGDSGEPTLIAFLAHWSPHDQAWLSTLLDLQNQGAFDEVRAVAALTGTDPARPNYPGSSWLEQEGWTGEVLLDDEPDPSDHLSSVARAYGLSGYPYLVMVDSAGQVIARASGEVPEEELTVLIDQAVRGG